MFRTVLLACVLPLHAETNTALTLKADSLKQIAIWIKDGEQTELRTSMRACKAASFVGPMLGSFGGAYTGRLIGAYLDSIFWTGSGSGIGPLEFLGSLALGSQGTTLGTDTAQWVCLNLFTSVAPGVLPSPEQATTECYDTLGVSDQHSWSDVVAAYRELGKTAHPDKGGTYETMMKLNVCKEVLRIGIAGKKGKKEEAPKAEL